MLASDSSLAMTVHSDTDSDVSLASSSSELSESSATSSMLAGVPPVLELVLLGGESQTAWGSSRRLYPSADRL